MDEATVKIPEKNQSAYALWMNEKRKKEKYKSLPLIQSTIILSKIWNELDPKVKEKWNKKASKDYIRYIKELATLKKTNPNLFKPDTDKSKKRKREKILTGYNLFCIEEKDKVSDLPFSERPKELGNRWRAIGEEGRKKWNELAKDRKDISWHDESNQTKKQKKSEANSNLQTNENDNYLNNVNEHDSDTENDEYE